ncbi:hypothetical protein ABT297_43025 [Dactylosporangium sp. NPDC000555]|uniref:hypothetical protein n=1 Tax=Dactylosporangium sp. NPDC000555 TaxID=3154260 RepID=UPI003332C340
MPRPRDRCRLHHLVGGWQDEETDTWPVVSSLVRAMATTHLGGGRDVVLPQYFARVDEIAGFEKLAREHGAGFREVVLLDDREAAIDRFNRRAQGSDDPWIRHHHRLIELGGGPVVPSPVGAVQETYELLVDALREPISP